MKRAYKVSETEDAEDHERDPMSPRIQNPSLQPLAPHKVDCGNKAQSPEADKRYHPNDYVHHVHNTSLEAGCQKCSSHIVHLCKVFVKKALSI